VRDLKRPYRSNVRLELDASIHRMAIGYNSVYIIAFRLFFGASDMSR